MDKHIENTVEINGQIRYLYPEYFSFYITGETTYRTFLLVLVGDVKGKFLPQIGQAVLPLMINRIRSIKTRLCL